ncbi:copper resistance protein NlpE [Ornithobacterium rhinotracheale]|uniref:copper resistance protein NlpE n=1 Tax=Ornithobacterium rhinotracheale TaxID=28251 RepID=UPI00129C9DBB|nr:copper resistance protein NlpE [Ornithobacterium rhinotracheale]MRI63932.1 copper resistance protein NlpE [Ornithobacterium rhinotracheale]
MKKIILSVAVASLALSACQKKEQKVDETQVTTEQAENVATPAVKDYAGEYEGVEPCADCEGMKITLTLNADNTFVQNTEYLGKETNNEFTDKGTYTWNNDGTIVTLTPENAPDQISHFKVEEGKLIQLDSDQKVIEGDLADNYILNKK